MSKRENRVINAFINCVKRGEYTFEYACLLIEDTQRYGYLTNEAKEVFYAEFENDETDVDEAVVDEAEINDIEKTDANNTIESWV